MDARLIRINPPNSQDIHTNPLPSHGAAWPSVKMILLWWRRVQSLLIDYAYQWRSILPRCHSTKRSHSVGRASQIHLCQPFCYKSCMDLKRSYLDRTSNSFNPLCKLGQFTPELVLQATSVPASDITQIRSMTRFGGVYSQKSYKKTKNQWQKKAPT